MNDLFSQELILANSRARLEPLTESHYQFLWPIAAHKELWEFTSVKVNTEDDFKKYFNQALSERKDCLCYPFAIFDKQNNRYAGSTRFGNFSFEHKKVEIGWTWYDPSLQRTGLSRACKALLLGYGFETLDLNRIELKTSLTNIKSQTAMQRMGATKEGVHRKHMINDDGSSRDSVFFSIIKEEWPAIKQRVFSEWDQ